MPSSIFGSVSSAPGGGYGGLDLGDSLLGAIAPDGEVARRAGRVLAAFYIPSMPPALLEQHGIEPERVAPVTEAFAAGDIQRALKATPKEIADRIMVAGTPRGLAEVADGDLCSAGLNHALVSFTDPFTLRAPGQDEEVEGYPIWENRSGWWGSRLSPSYARYELAPSAGPGSALATVALIPSGGDLQARQGD